MKQMLQDFDRIEALFLTGAQHTGQDRMGLGTGIGAIAAAGLADDEGRPQFALGCIVGGRHRRVIQEGEQARALLAQGLGEAGIVRIRQVVGQEPGWR